jgi:4-amino-4-deoxy-L-arabinose transferase-like glycosyltransferase
VSTKHKILLLAAIMFFSMIRFRLRDMPLERDEGEYAYAGQLLLEGIPPYQLAYNMKLPGTYAAYAGIFTLFGQSAQAVHLGLILVNAATILLVALLGRRLYGSTGGLAAGVCYALLSTSPTVLGFAAHATHFVVLAAVAGALLLLEPVGKSRWRIFAGGVAMGMALLMKQPGAGFIAFGALYLIVKRVRVLPVYLAGAALPFGLTCLLLWRAGVFAKFWFWTVSYGEQYGSIISPATGLLLLLGTLPKVIGPSFLLWILAAMGAYRLCRTRGSFFTLSLLALSFAAVSAGLYFRSHYFVMLLPAISLLAGAGLASAAKTFLRPAVAVFLAGVGLSLFLQRDYLFAMSPAQASASTYGENPFPQAQTVARYLREQPAPQASLAVLGSEPEIYFYAHRHSATGYIYTNGLMEPQKYAARMQDEMIAEIEHSQPEYVVYVSSPPSWLRQKTSGDHIFVWAAEFLSTHYERIELPGSEGLQTFRRKIPALPQLSNADFEAK